MARSHHRKKHKAHLQNFKSSHNNDTIKTKVAGSNGKWVFAIAGLVLGFAVSYFASGGSMLWTALGSAAGLAAGYYTGVKVDSLRK